MSRTTDNNRGNYEVNDSHLTNLQQIANAKISEIAIEENSDLLIFPHSFKSSEGKIADKNIFTLQGNQLTTGNIMGFVGVNESQITIESRFAKENEDYFMHFMLQKVFSINLFDLKHSSNQENVFDFLLYLFPFYLKKAMNQGLYKEYQKNTYNDANVKGSIDVKQNIKYNIPFNGKIYYRVREHSYDNRITQLIRHTIDFIKKHKYANKVLTADGETQNFVMQIMQATPSYNRNARRSIINKNLKPVVHPYYSQYRDLQKICMQILRYEGLKFGSENDKIYGLLFDGAWLWEEYLNTILKEAGFNHPRNDLSTGALYLFKEPKGYTRYPDFWKRDFILDAKYIRIDDNGTGRDAMHQIVSYMYMLKAGLGGFVFPTEKRGNVKEVNIGVLNGYSGKVKTWSFPIPQTNASFEEFCAQIIKTEKELLQSIVQSEKELTPKSEIMSN